MSTQQTNTIAIILLLVGLMQMTGDLLNLPALKGIGAATMISPAPKVFTAIRGYEAYSTRFYLEWTDRNGVAHSQPLTPERYQRVAGPYNRRNIYGAVLAGGPVLATDERLRPLFDSVSRFALSGDAALLRELGIDPASIDGTIRVRYEPLPGTQMKEWPRVLEIKSQRNSTGSGSDRGNA